MYVFNSNEGWVGTGALKFSSAIADSKKATDKQHWARDSKQPLGPRPRWYVREHFLLISFLSQWKIQHVLEILLSKEKITHWRVRVQFYHHENFFLKPSQDTATLNWLETAPSLPQHKHVVKCYFLNRLTQNLQLIHELAHRVLWLFLMAWQWKPALDLEFLIYYST